MTRELKEVNAMRRGEKGVGRDGKVEGLRRKKEVQEMVWVKVEGVGEVGI